MARVEVNGVWQCYRSGTPKVSSFTGRLKSRGNIQLGLIGSRVFIAFDRPLFACTLDPVGPRLFHPYLDARTSFANEKLLQRAAPRIKSLLLCLPSSNLFLSSSLSLIHPLFSRFLNDNYKYQQFYLGITLAKIIHACTSVYYFYRMYLFIYTT